MKQIEESMFQVLEQSQMQVVSLRDQNQALKLNNAHLQSQNKLLRTSLHDKQKREEQLLKKNQFLERQNKKKEGQYRDLEASLKVALKKIQTLSRESMSLINENLDFEDQFEEKDKSIADLNEVLQRKTGEYKHNFDDLKKKYEELQIQHQKLRKQKEKYKEQYLKLKENYKRLLEGSKILNEKYGEATNSIQEMKQAFKDKLTKIFDEKVSTEQKNINLATKIRILESRISEMKKSQEEQRERGSRSTRD